MQFFTYMIQNRINQKIYVGYTNDFALRFRAHLNLSKKQKRIFHYALAKYGSDNFDWILVGRFDTEAEAQAEEVRLIEEYRTNITRHGLDFGYNLTDGGEGAKGRKHTLETIEKMKRAHKDKKHTEETKEKLRQINIGKKQSAEAKAAQIAAQIGKVFSEETKLKISMAKRAAPKKTHCINGHEFNSENTTYHPKKFRRDCKICANARARAIRAKKLLSK